MLTVRQISHTHSHREVVAPLSLSLSLAHPQLMWAPCATSHLRSLQDLPSRSPGAADHAQLTWVTHSPINYASHDSLSRTCFPAPKLLTLRRTARRSPRPSADRGQDLLAV